MQALKTATLTRPAVTTAGRDELVVPAPLPEGAHLSLVTSAAGLAAIARDWRSLEDAAGNPLNVFQSHAWLSAWADVYSAGNACAQPLIVTGYQGRDLVFAMPLVRTCFGPVRVVRWLTDPFGQYGDIVIARGHCPRQWLAGAIAILGQLKNIDVLRLRYVRSDAAIRPFAGDRMRKANLAEKAAYLDLTQYAGEAAYDARYTPAQRKRRKKIRKELETRGAVEFNRLPPGPATALALNRAFAEKNAWLAERARQNRVIGCPLHIAFLKRLAASKSADLDLVTTELTAGGEPMSWEIGLRYRGRHFAYITSHVNALTDLSPARLHMDLSQRLAIKDGMKVFDLMVPYDPHKESWSSGVVETEDYYLALTPLGRLYGAGYLEVLRPIARKAYYEAPAGLRRIVKPLFGL
jgi:CelD/BcsL family acetyltransferase involved in cellulose biosynthesis